MSLSLLLPLSCTFSFHFSFVRRKCIFSSSHENLPYKQWKRWRYGSDEDSNWGNDPLFYPVSIDWHARIAILFSIHISSEEILEKEISLLSKCYSEWLLEKPDGIWCFWRDKSLVRHKSACLCLVKYPKVIIILGASVLGIFVVLWFCFVVIVITYHYCYYHHYYQFIIIVIITIII